MQQMEVYGNIRNHKLMFSLPTRKINSIHINQKVISFHRALLRVS
jgi:hypothetical protein